MRIALTSSARSAMSPRVVLLVTMGVAVLCAYAAVAPDVSSASRPSCLRPGDTVQSETTKAIVVSNRRTAVRDGDGYSVFGCLTRTGRRFRLDRWPHDLGFEVAALKGTFVASVAYATRDPSGDSESQTMHLTMTDLRNGAVYNVARAVVDPLGVVTRVVLKRDGSLAYQITRDLDQSRNQLVEDLMACEIATCYGPTRRAANVKRLDTGFIKSLRVSGDQLTWVNDGVAKSGRLR